MKGFSETTLVVHLFVCQISMTENMNDMLMSLNIPNLCSFHNHFDFN